MRRFAAIFCFTIFALSITSQAATVDGFLDLKDELPYRLFVPKNYDQSKKYPLLVFLHGSGGRGTNNTSNITGGNESGSHFMTADAVQSKTPCFVFAPQCPSNQTWACQGWSTNNGYFSIDDKPEGQNITKMLGILDKIIGEYSIDEDRLYITGQSMGGGGTWETILRHPNKFAAAVPVCGHNDTTKAALIKHLPLWIFHGLKDGTVKPITDQAMVASLEMLGAENLKVTWYPDKSHFVWNPAYSTEGLAEWILSFSQSGRPVQAGVQKDNAVYQKPVMHISGRNTVSLDITEGDAVARIFNVQGACVFSKHISSSATVNADRLGAGTYLLTLNDGNAVFNYSVIIR